MAKEKRNKDKDAVSKAHDEAEKDISKDPAFTGGDPSDDLDEGELARKDNSDEDAFDSFEGRHQGKPSEGSKE